MKFFWIYWVAGCLLVGFGAGLRETRCPDDPFETVQEYFFTVATWPGGLSWAMTNSRLPPCKFPVRK